MHHIFGDIRNFPIRIGGHIWGKNIYCTTDETLYEIKPINNKLGYIIIVISNDKWTLFVHRNLITLELCKSKFVVEISMDSKG